MNRFRRSTIEYDKFDLKTYTSSEHQYLYGWEDKQYTKYNFTSWDPAGETQYGEGIACAFSVIADDKICIRVIENSIEGFVGNIYYVDKTARANGTTLYPLYIKNENNYIEANICVKIFNIESEEIITNNNDSMWPKYDTLLEDPYYEKDSFITSIETKSVNDPQPESIEFNCIIPLFDVYNVKKSTYYVNENVQDITADEDYTNYKGVPYGIWLSENSVTLFNEKPFKQTWTLSISSKFSPFPYHIKDGVKAETSDTDITSNVNLTTYTDVLAQQTDLMRKYREALDLIGTLTAQVQEYKASFDALAAIYNIDDIKTYVENTIKELKDEVDFELGEMNEKLNNIIWKKIN